MLQLSNSSLLLIFLYSSSSLLRIDFLKASCLFAIFCIMRLYEPNLSRKVDNFLAIINQQNLITMQLPPIRNLLHSLPSSKKKSSSLNNNRNSERMIQYAPKIIRARYYTEEKDSNLSKRLMNYIGFDKVKANKNYTQICQENLRRYHQEKQEMRQLQGNSQRALSQIKKMKLNLSPRGNAISLHMKTEKSTLEMKHSRKRIESQNRNRLQTEIANNENRQIRMKLKQQMRELQQDCMKIKKYSQMSIRQIIQKDVAQNEQSKKRLFQGNRHHRLEGWPY